MANLDVDVKTAIAKIAEVSTPPFRWNVQVKVLLRVFYGYFIDAESPLPRDTRRGDTAPLQAVLFSVSELALS